MLLRMQPKQPLAESVERVVVRLTEVHRPAQLCSAAISAGAPRHADEPVFCIAPHRTGSNGSLLRRRCTDRMQ
jgi:hypothetical protein